MKLAPEMARSRIRVRIDRLWERSEELQDTRRTILQEWQALHPIRVFHAGEVFRRRGKNYRAISDRDCGVISWDALAARHKLSPNAVAVAASKAGVTPTPLHRLRGIHLELEAIDRQIAVLQQELQHPDPRVWHPRNPPGRPVSAASRARAWLRDCGERRVTPADLVHAVACSYRVALGVLYDAEGKDWTRVQRGIYERTSL